MSRAVISFLLCSLIAIETVAILIPYADYRDRERLRLETLHEKIYGLILKNENCGAEESLIVFDPNLPCVANRANPYRSDPHMDLKHYDVRDSENSLDEI